MIKKKSASRLRWIAVLSLPITGIIRFIVSIVFFLLGLVAADPASGLVWDTLLGTIQMATNWILGILWLLSIPLSIVGVIMLIKGWQGLIGESIVTGWAWAKKYIGKWIWFILGYLALTTILSLILWDWIPYLIITQILWILFGICVVSAAIHVIYNNSLAWKDYFDIDFMKVARYIWWLIMYLIVMVLWFILLIIPGIILSVRLSFFNVAILKDGLSPIEALKHSRKITKGNFWNIVWLMIIQWLIQIPGALALLIWLFWTVPMWWMSNVKAYQMLSNKYKESA